MSYREQELEQQVNRLQFELGRVRETVENQFNRIEVLEAKIAKSTIVFPDETDLPIKPEDGKMVGFLKGATELPLFHLESSTTAPLIGSPGLGCYALKGKTQLVMGITVFDLDIVKLQNIVRQISEKQRKTRKFTPVFFTNNPDFSPFRSQKYLYEYFRTDTTLAEMLQDPNYSLFLQERFQFMLQKWGIDLIIDMSQESF